MKIRRSRRTFSDRFLSSDSDIRAFSCGYFRGNIAGFVEIKPIMSSC